MRAIEEIMPDGFQIHVRLHGSLMEPDAAFPKPRQTPGTAYLINLEELTAINSIGIRSFMQWMRELGDLPITFMNCPKFFIDQVNMVVDFIPKHSRIHSFYVPYYSEANETDRMVLYRAGLEYRRVAGDRVEVAHPTNIVDESGQPMEIDIMGERFFKFLDKHV